MSRVVKFYDLGLQDYQEVWDLQERLLKETVERKISNRKVDLPHQIITENFLLFVEHPHVYTLGKSGDENNLKLDEEGLESHQAKFYKINRGGDITYHGPGQLVGYPIFDLDHFFTDIHKYLRYLEEAVIRTCIDFGLDAGRVEGLTGVWINPGSPHPRKVCAIGVKSSRWVTMHGFAFNVNSDMAYFDHIVPCGIDDKDVTSLENELNHKMDMEEVKDKVLDYLQEVFEFDVTHEASIELVKQ